MEKLLEDYKLNSTFYFINNRDDFKKISVLFKGYKKIVFESDKEKSLKDLIDLYVRKTKYKRKDFSYRWYVFFDMIAYPTWMKKQERLIFINSLKKFYDVLGKENYLAFINCLVKGVLCSKIDGKCAFILVFLDDCTPLKKDLTKIINTQNKLFINETLKRHLRQKLYSQHTIHNEILIPYKRKKTKKLLQLLQLVKKHYVDGETYLSFYFRKNAKEGYLTKKMKEHPRKYFKVPDDELINIYSELKSIKGGSISLLKKDSNMNGNKDLKSKHVFKEANNLKNKLCSILLLKKGFSVRARDKVFLKTTLKEFAESKIVQKNIEKITKKEVELLKYLEHKENLKK